MLLNSNSTTAASPNPLTLDHLIAPALDVLQNYVRGVRRDIPLHDARFVRFGIARVLSQSVSGRDFLQLQREVQADELAKSTCFDSLHSPRRLQVLSQLSAEVAHRHRQELPDLLANFPEFKHRRVYAVDGQHICHAVHAARDPKGEYVSVNSMYLTCLHSGLLENFAAVQGDGERRHEMPVFRRRMADWLRNRSFDHRKSPPILVVDMAYVDTDYWTRILFLKEKGAQVITREKENMKATVMGHPQWDKSATVNQGVLHDEHVGYGNSRLMRRVTYQDPETGTVFKFLTTVMDLAPGLIALLYLLRWRIEKLFDTAKNKLQETKAWANGTVAQDIQAHLLALTHNLLMLIRAQLARDHQIQETKVEEKRAVAMKYRLEKAARVAMRVAEYHGKLPGIVQLTVQFIRTIRNGILSKTPWVMLLEPLRRSMESY